MTTLQNDLVECPVCGGKVTRAQSTFDARVGSRTVAVSGTYTKCIGECGEFFLSPAELDDVMLRASATIRAENGLLTPADIRALRNALGLTQPQFELLLGVGPKTVVRWEKGTVFQNGATDTLLRVLRDVPGAASYLAKVRGISLTGVPSTGRRIA